MNKLKLQQWASWLSLSTLWVLLEYYGVIVGNVHALGGFKWMTYVLVAWWSFISIMTVMARVVKLPPPTQKIHVPYWCAFYLDMTVGFIAAVFGHPVLAVFIVFQNALEKSYRNYIEGKDNDD